MKLITSILIALSITTYAQAKKDEPKKEDKKPPKEIGSAKILTTKEANIKKKEQQVVKALPKYIADFIEKEYVKEAEKKAAKLQKDVTRLEKRIAVTTSVKLKKKMVEDLKELKAQLEAQKIWPLYHKAYVIKVKAIESKDDETYGKTKAYIKKLEKRYKELTATKFPNVRGIFSARYSSQISKMKKEAAK